ncbi:hypothetical protein [Streptomyces sp. NPDC048248]|uniref:hypothetical protein n=1 Tax=Streptomyces sp. NPDC048248 TaxID=3365523 RepID=UPI00371C1629
MRQDVAQAGGMAGAMCATLYARVLGTLIAGRLAPAAVGQLASMGPQLFARGPRLFAREPQLVAAVIAHGTAVVIGMTDRTHGAGLLS